MWSRRGHRRCGHRRWCRRCRLQKRKAPRLLRRLRLRLGHRGSARRRRRAIRLHGRRGHFGRLLGLDGGCVADIGLDAGKRLTNGRSSVLENGKTFRRWRLRRNCDDRRYNCGNRNGPDPPNARREAVLARPNRRRRRHEGGLKSRWRQWRGVSLFIRLFRVEALFVRLKLSRRGLWLGLVPSQICRRMRCGLLGFKPRMRFGSGSLFVTPNCFFLTLLPSDPGRRIHKLPVTVVVDWGTHN